MRCCSTAVLSGRRRLVPLNSLTAAGRRSAHRAVGAFSEGRASSAVGRGQMQESFHSLLQQQQQQGQPSSPIQQQQQQQQQQGQQQHPAAAADVSPAHAWTKHMSTAYMLQNRNWAAVEDFYLQLVSGRQCLSAIGLSPAGPPAGATQGQQQQQQQQQHRKAPKVPPATAGSKRPVRVTYKLHVSYLGGSFCGWQRGNSHSKPAVQDCLARGIAATGLCEQADTSPGAMSKRAAARALRKQQAQQRAKQLAAPADAEAADGAGPAQTQPAAAGMAPDGVGGSSGGSSSRQPQVPALQCGGRTDAGVTAAGQVVSFYSWQPPVSGAELAARINAQLEQQWAQTAEAAAAEATAAAAGAVAAESTSSGSSASHQPPHTAEPPAALASSPQPEQLPPVCPLRVWQAEQVPRQFHATFSASWRRYVYLLPLRGGLPAGASAQQLLPRYTTELQQQPCDLTAQQLQAVQAAPDVDPALVDALLQPLQGRRLDFHAFARDTQQGKDCVCTLQVARASLVWLPVPAQQQQDPGHDHSQAILHQQQQQQQWPCLAVELVADRFLRKMVRVLVGTLVREAVALAQSRQQQQQQQQPAAVDGSQSHSEGGSEAMLALAASMDRRATAGPAPGLGLCFAAVGYDQDTAC